MPSSGRGHLPAQPTPLHGRADAIASARQVVLGEEVRLLTFAGPAGIGKTRLALAVAASLEHEYPQEAWFVDLAPITDPALVPTGIAQALTLTLATDAPPIATLCRALRERRLVLVLDNFEQVLEAATSVAELLAGLPDLVVLATSREPLHLRWEREFPVPPLALPDLGDLPPPAALAAVPAVALFIDRLRAVRPDFGLDASTAPIVAEICHRLDGLPLALELAAARGKHFPPATLLARLRGSFDLLAGGPRDLPDRQQTLRAAIGWSYDLLPREEQALFRRLAVFAGGGDLELITRVCVPPSDLPRPIDDLVASLADKSLVRLDTSPTGKPRCRMPEMIREYAAERLAASGEHETTRERHAASFLTLAEELSKGLFTPQHGPLLDRLEREHDNCRAALAWFLGREDVERALRLGTALGWFWVVRGYIAEGRERLGGVLALARRSGEPPSRALVRALTMAGNMANRQADYSAALPNLEESLALSRKLSDLWEGTEALSHLAVGAYERGEYALARERFRKVLAAARHLGNEQRVASAWSQLGHIAYNEGDLATAQRNYEEALTLYERLGDAQRIARTFENFGRLAYHRGDFAAARRFLEHGLAGFRAVGYRAGTADTLCDLGHLALDQGDLPTARARFAESLTFVATQGRSLALLFDGVAGLALAQGEPSRALRLLGAASALREANGAKIPAPWAVPRERALTTARQALGADAAAAALVAGGSLSLDEAIAEARRAVEPAAPRSAEPAAQPLAPRPIPFARQDREDRAAEPAEVRRQRLTLVPDRSASTPAGHPLVGGLTAREAEVLRHVATGQTNREIAAALSISEKTVARHLSNIFGKIEVSTRAAATAFALREGIA